MDLFWAWYSGWFETYIVSFSQKNLKLRPYKKVLYMLKLIITLNWDWFQHLFETFGWENWSAVNNSCDTSDLISQNKFLNIVF